MYRKVFPDKANFLLPQGQASTSSSKVPTKGTTVKAPSKGATAKTAAQTAVRTSPTVPHTSASTQHNLNQAKALVNKWEHKKSSLKRPRSQLTDEDSDEDNIGNLNTNTEL